MLKIIAGKWYQILTSLLMVSVIVLMSTAQAQQSFNDYLKQQNQAYNDYEKKQNEEFEKYKQEVLKKWNDFMNSTRRDWYEYSHDLNTLSHVDFENGQVTIETVVPVDSKDIQDQVQKNITDQIKGLLSTDSLTKEKVLDNQVVSPSGEIIDSANADKFVKNQVLPTAVQTDSIKSADGVERIKTTATFRLVPDHIRVRAEQYLPSVRKYCFDYKLDLPLVMAIMQTESYFNPRAKSTAPAFGLMQLVPNSGARDAYNYAFQQDKIVTSDYLYIPDNNIQLGCAYLAKMRDNEFKAISDTIKQRYCLIASYNTGPGNLCKAVSGNTSTSMATDIINALAKEALYTKLQSDLPYEETQDYLEKVEKRRENYQEWQ